MPSGETPGAVAIVTPGDRQPVAVVATDEGGLAGLDLSSGAVVWSERMPGRLRGVPVAAGGSVALVWERDDVRVMLVDAATGALRWQQPIPERAGTPAVDGDTLVVGAGTGKGDGRAFAFALADGVPRWKARTGASFQPDSVPTIDGRDVFLVDELGGVDRLDLGSGQRVWHRALGEAVLIARPVVVGDAVRSRSRRDRRGPRSGHARSRDRPGPGAAHRVGQCRCEWSAAGISCSWRNAWSSATRSRRMAPIGSPARPEVADESSATLLADPSVRVRDLARPSSHGRNRLLRAPSHGRRTQPREGTSAWLSSL